MIVAVNGTQLLSYAREMDSLLVYTWSPHCTSKSCILISAFQDYCDSKNYEMVVVADYYDMQMMNAQNNLDLPILIANHNYYGKYYANGLNKRFIKDLLADSEKDYEPTGGRFLLLSKGKLVWQRMELKKK